LPELQGIHVTKYFERETNKFPGIFVHAGEKPLLLEVLVEQLVHPDEITFLGNAKPPISIKNKQFKPMKDVIKFEMPEIQPLNVVKDVKIDIEVKFQLYLDAVPEVKADYDYVAFSNKILMSHFDELQNAIGFTNAEKTTTFSPLKFIGFKISETENLIVFDRNLLNMFGEKLKELLNSGLFFSAISERLFVPHIMQFIPKPDADWFDKEFVAESAESNKIILIPDPNILGEFYNYRSNKWNPSVGKLSRTLKSINLLSIDDKWQSIKNLIFFLNPKLGRIISEQQESACDRF